MNIYVLFCIFLNNTVAFISSFSAVYQRASSINKKGWQLVRRASLFVILTNYYCYCPIKSICYHIFIFFTITFLLSANTLTM